MNRTAIRKLVLVTAVIASGVGAFAASQHAGAAMTVEVQVTGKAGVAADASAAAINLTATNGSGPGFATAYPCGSSVPATSTINFMPGDTIANSTIVDIGTSGKICLYASTTVDLIVDVQGWFPANATFTAINPQRLLDTRTTGSRPNATSIELQIGGKAGVAANASAVAINLTATNGSGPGFATAYPCGSSVPATSTINFMPGDTIANSTIVDIGTSGKICLYASTTVDLIVDVQGWFPANATFTAINPQRLLDTRTTGSRPNATSIELQIGGKAGVAANASAVAINLTATNGSGPGFATAYPCGSSVPATSTINFMPGDTIANSTIVDIGTSGKVCLYASTTVDLIVDVQGWFPANDSFTGINPERLIDTRTTAATPGPAPTAPAGAAFAEFFTGNTGLEKFDTGVYHRDNVLVANREWTGDHDLNCGTPDTQRVIHRNAPNEALFMCKDHLMTSMGDTSGYSIVWFSPKATFHGGQQTKVSFDASVTDLGVRKWWEVALVPVGEPYLATDAGISTPAGLPSYDAGSIVVGTGPFGKDGNIFSGGSGRDPFGMSHLCDFDPEGCASKAIRRTFTITDNLNGTITFDYFGQQYTYPGKFPSEFRVYFKDHNYTPDKQGVPVGHTWHWDSVVVS